MKVTVITVTYNSEQFINQCISSVLEQTYQDVEYIIIDGNSSDSTLKIVRSFPDILYVSEPDNGIYDAINKGIKMATGDLVGILNSDDFFNHKNVLARIVQEFQENEQIDAVFADVSFIDRVNPGKTLRYYSSKFFKPWMFKFGFQPAHPTLYVKKDVFNSHGLYRPDLKIAGDFEFMLRIFLKERIRFKYIDDLWVKMRVGGASTSGVQSLVLLNKEIIRSCRSNGIYTNQWMVYSKYLIKWWGFIFKKFDK